MIYVQDAGYWHKFSDVVGWSQNGCDETARCIEITLVMAVDLHKCSIFWQGEGEGDGVVMTFEIFLHMFVIFQLLFPEMSLMLRHPLLVKRSLTKRASPRLVFQLQSHDQLNITSEQRHPLLVRWSLTKRAIPSLVFWLQSHDQLNVTSEQRHLLLVRWSIYYFPEM